jgi:hypothetical protein
MRAVSGVCRDAFARVRPVRELDFLAFLGNENIHVA